METKNVIAALVVAAVLVALVAIGIALVRLELSMIYTLALILIGALSVALVIAALALPIQANRSGGPNERIIERHTIDGRRDPRIITMPHNRGDADTLFPRLMRDMLDGQQHLLGDGQNTNSPADENDAIDGNDWQGPIRG